LSETSGKISGTKGRRVAIFLVVENKLNTRFFEEHGER
jgi:hypothetical protein